MKIKGYVFILFCFIFYPFTFVYSASPSCINYFEGSDNADASSYTTSSFTPDTASLFLLTVESRTGITANPNIPSITATGGVIWTQVNTVVWDATSSSRKRSTIFYGVGTTTSSSVIKFDYAGQTQTVSVWTVDKCTGASLTFPVVQSNNIYYQDTAPLVSIATTTPLSTFASTDNAHYVSLSSASVLDTFNVGYLYTSLASTSNQTEDQHLRTMYIQNSTTTAYWTITPATGSAGWGIFSLEISASTTSAPTSTTTDYVYINVVENLAFYTLILFFLSFVVSIYIWGSYMS